MTPRTLALALLLLAACTAQAPFADDPPPSDRPIPLKPVYQASEGFVVHEWGTLTSVVGSDGTLLPGLHHEEEDLPGFVADRAAGNNIPPVHQKMETPVTYFYFPSALSVKARVHFTDGLFTQWFPYVKATAPMVIAGGGGLVDPWLRTDLRSEACKATFSGPLHGGMLDWGTVDVLPPHNARDLASPLGQTTWAFARNTASNPIRVTRPNSSETQTEKFLFYRGLGNFDLPVHPSWNFDAASGRSQPKFANADHALKMGGLVLLVVTPTSAGFALLGDLPAGATLAAKLPEPTLSHPLFVQTLKDALSNRLVEDGLFRDEAQAMVDTWERSYFLTPGVRLLYLLPQARTEQVIPLELTPRPDQVIRTMVIRLELVSPDHESALGTWLDDLGAPGRSPEKREAARARFLALGRFAEPHLTRAIALSGDAAVRAAGEVLLATVRQNRRWAPTSAE
ncbi:MAG: hypothetical protein EXR72_00185 [Myxococcales bacterium]|nr:hypothetical protein [Myxococcales bacterium]